MSGSAMPAPTADPTVAHTWFVRLTFWNQRRTQALERVEFVRDDAIAQRLEEALVHNYDEDEEKERTLMYVIHHNAPILADD
jgi:hypothetical protein